MEGFREFAESLEEHAVKYDLNESPRFVNRGLDFQVENRNPRRRGRNHCDAIYRLD